MVTANKVAGIKKSEHNIRIYTLSTCVWCRKTKRLMDNLGLPYEYIDVDKLESRDKVEAMKELREYNPRCTFPTTVIDGSKCITGFKEDEIKEALS